MEAQMETREYATIFTKIKKADDDSRVIKFIGTTAVRDRMGDEIPLSGWDFKAYRKNPIVLWAHDYSQPPIGRTLKIKKEEVEEGKQGWAFEVEFAPGDANPKAEQIYQLVKRGFVNAVSVGFQSHESQWIEEEEDDKEKSNDKPDIRPGKIFKKKELLELSVVPVPANPEALIAAKQKGEISVPKELDVALTEYYVTKASKAIDTTRRILEKLKEKEVITKPGWEDKPDWKEIKYRVRDPKLFKDGTFRRVTIQKKKPKVIAIMGKLKGEDTMTIQSLRFPKDDGWTVEKAKAWVKAHKDSLKEMERTLSEFDLYEELNLKDWEGWVDRYFDPDASTDIADLFEEDEKEFEEALEEIGPEPPDETEAQPEEENAETPEEGAQPETSENAETSEEEGEKGMVFRIKRERDPTFKVKLS